MAMEINTQTLSFIKEHCNDDVRKLALSVSKDAEIDMPFALDQIQGRQAARRKLPSWAAMDHVIYPPHISMEQCSSEFTAKYKVGIINRFINAKDSIFVDVTGGFGVDFSYLAQGFLSSVYIERQEHLCDIARHNMPLLGLHNATIVCGDGSDYLKSMELAHPLAVFIDPARRDINGKRTYAISDCAPDILGFIDELAQKAEVILIKLSPMLDWHATISDINKAVKGDSAVREVHIISTGNECKELLIVVSTRSASPLRIYCVNDENDFSFYNEECDSTPAIAYPENLLSGKDDNLALYVPNASIMKAGCFNLISAHFGINQISKNSHLFVGTGEICNFPGRFFHIDAITSMNKKEMKIALQGIENANITTRNFPLSPEQLRKRLKIKDGGDIYIFATTSNKGEHILIITHK